jgi:hypothetical protein
MDLVGVSSGSGGVGWPSCTGGNWGPATVGDGEDVRARAEWAKPRAPATLPARRSFYTERVKTGSERDSTALAISFYPFGVTVWATVHFLDLLWYEDKKIKTAFFWWSLTWLVWWVCSRVFFLRLFWGSCLLTTEFGVWETSMGHRRRR